jgi:hypothetical protein
VRLPEPAAQEQGTESVIKIKISRFFFPVLPVFTTDAVQYHMHSLRHNDHGQYKTQGFPIGPWNLKKNF